MWRELIEFGELYECTIFGRVSRFTAIVEVQGSKVAAYINNTGRLYEYMVKGRVGYCIKTQRGKLKYRIIGVEDGHYAALLDTTYQEKAFTILQEHGMVPWLSNCTLYKRNYKLGRETIDFAYTCREDLVLVELKSAVMKLGESIAGYPDAPTARGRRQIRSLAEYAKTGKKAIIVLMAGIPGAQKVKFYCLADKKICEVVKYAVRSGVLFKAVNLYLNPVIKSVVSASVDVPIDISLE